MATTFSKVDESVFGNKRVQYWTITAGASDTTVTWDTGLDNVLHVSLTTNSDQSFGGVYRNFSDAGTTVAAGNVHVAGLANSSICAVKIEGN